MIPRLVISGTASGVGKTTVTVALTRALRTRGLRVAPFKCGPDYLDPTYHARAAGSPCHNLDGWLMGQRAVLETFTRAASDADIAIVEGVMGTFDGASPTSDAGSTAQIAKWLAAPVALVCDASGMARSIAALVHGFATFDPALRIGAVIANRVGSRGHLDLLRKALPAPPIAGGFTEDALLAFPERHLGLTTAAHDVVPESLFAAWGERAAEWLDLDALLELARSAPALPTRASASAVRASASSRCRIGVAHDAAFHFYYEDNLRRLEALGAELVRFSPLRDRELPAVDGLYIGGGYPEIHAEELAANKALLGRIADFSAAGGPIYAECGGLMLLTAGITTSDGRLHPMVGVFPAHAEMRDRLQALGYVEVETTAPTPLGATGVRFRGHQFRYSELRQLDRIDCAYAVRRSRDGELSREGWIVKNTLGSYVHAHWGENPAAAAGFVDACVAFRTR
ncbi:MAG TPA: cobyrinate a,c-diamide synthase [Polyangiaceae bacterium]|nr:cobyrinate a,c-diamide synthase [Polyangiaceae bacterium]